VVAPFKVPARAFLKTQGAGLARIPLISAEMLSPTQSEITNRMASGPRGGVRGPYKVFLHSPDLANRLDPLGVYLRYQGAVPVRLREFAICVVAAHWRANYAWHAHANIARRQGVSDQVLEALQQQECPVFENEDEDVVYKYCHELLNTGTVKDSTFNAVNRILGVRGGVDLTALVGYYSLVSFTLNAFDVSVSEGVVSAWNGSDDN